MPVNDKAFFLSEQRKVWTTVFPMKFDLIVSTYFPANTSPVIQKKTVKWERCIEKMYVLDGVRKSDVHMAMSENIFQKGNIRQQL